MLLPGGIFVGLMEDRGIKMSLFDKMIDKRIAAYQGDLLTTHYA